MSKKPLATLAILVALLLLPVSGGAEMYVGLYIGGNFAAETTPRWDAARIGGTMIPPPLPVRTFWAHGVSPDPALVVGGKIGYWFSREGLLSLDYPDWLKYFGFEIQLDWHNLDWGRQNVTIEPIGLNIPLENDGYMITLAFLLMGRYGFMPDQEVPFGRLQPYIGVGPAVIFTRTHLNIGRDYKSTEADLGLAVETGLRYMIRKNISVHAAFRYRFVKVHADVDDKIFGIAPYYIYIPMRAKYSLFNILIGASYHF
ncbi:MAG: outer membrane beta-barrel protein [Syntrophobacterales bacterium]|nr:outer membrane beta-barrel protein [Syntrophobacterales bacterium]